MTTQIKTNYGKASIICLLASLFYLYEFILQVSPAVMTNQLMQAYSVGAAGLGTLSAAYYYAYTPMQLPAGVLYDRLGPRILLTLSTAVCALGAIFFSVSDSVILASAGRFCMGFGSAFSFIGTLVLISRWFPAKYFALLAGIAQLMSSVGAIFGEAPLARAIDSFGWRTSLMVLAFIGLVLALAMWLIIRDCPPGYKLSNNHSQERSDSINALRYVLSNKQTWLIAIYAFAVWAPIVIFAALWGVPYLEALYHVSTEQASFAVSLVWIGIGLGSPFVGWVSDRIGSRNKLLNISAAMGIAATLCIVCLHGLPFYFMYILLFGLGFAAAGQSLSFGVIKDITPPAYVGTAVGFNNMAVVAGGALLQPLVGVLLNYFWDGTRMDHIPVYTVHAYQESLWILPACYILALTLSALFIQETRCEAVYKKKNNNNGEDQYDLSGQAFSRTS